MRWSDHLAAMCPLNQQRLVNHITAGCGFVAVAARLISTDAHLAEVGYRLLAAQTALICARSLLTGAHTSSHMLPDNQRGPAVSWQALIAEQDPTSSDRILASLRDAVACARCVGQSVLANDHVEALRERLDGAVVALARTRRLIADTA